ncbi:hypothetical protein [Lentisalinibacter sediminis]|uniref:hypothetical protein n=1 Tax=Lentisalinibacter sediminis TaxID=2992237 RepID=UPI003868EF03
MSEAGTNAERLRNMSEAELRARATESVKTIARTLAETLSPDDSWRLLMGASVWVLLGMAGTEGTAATLREMADKLEEDGDEALH